MYLKRDENHKVIAISLTPDNAFKEPLSDQTTHEVLEFLKHSPQLAQSYDCMKTPESLSETKESLAESDEKFIRVLEDLINLLTEKGFIQFTELPSKAQEKLLKRQNIRARNNQLNLIEDDEQFLDLP